MSNLWSIYLKPTELAEGTEVWDMLQRFPHAAIHDGLNYVFVTNHPAAFEPIDLSVAEYETVDQLIAIIANALFSDDRSRAIHLTKSQAVTLYAHPAWKLWCGRYDNKDALEADHKSFFGTSIDDSKSLDTLINNAKNNLKSLLT